MPKRRIGRKRWRQIRQRVTMRSPTDGCDADRQNTKGMKGQCSGSCSLMRGHRDRVKSAAHGCSARQRKTGVPALSSTTICSLICMVISLTQWDNNRAGTATALVWRNAQHGASAGCRYHLHADISGRGGCGVGSAMARRHKHAKRVVSHPHTVCRRFRWTNDQLIVVAAKPVT